MKYKKVVVAGGGVLGSQIAFQCAHSNFDTTILTHDEKSIEGINQRLDKLLDTYIETINLLKDNYIKNNYLKKYLIIEVFFNNFIFIIFLLKLHLWINY